MCSGIFSASEPPRYDLKIISAISTTDDTGEL